MTYLGQVQSKQDKKRLSEIQHIKENYMETEEDEERHDLDFLKLKSRIR